MVFKLVRTDSEEPCKIQLSIGTHVLGRGKFLDCDDKRVSRNHGELEVKEDTVIVKALHQNPCFIIRKEAEDTLILEQNCSSSITNGDRFGLLPHTYWYELLHCTAADAAEPAPTTVPETNEGVDSVATQPFENEKDESSSEINFNFDETVTNDENQGSPSMLPTESYNEPVTSSTETVANDDANGEKSPIKRPHSCEDSDTSSSIKKIKTENEDRPQINQEPGDNPEINQEPEDNPEIKQEPGDNPEIKEKPGDTSEIKQEPGDSPEIKQEPPSLLDTSNPTPVINQVNNQAGPSNPNNADKDAGNAPANLPANPLKRERCMYGANCYRRNPQHKAQFSHPSDADWGAGDRGECPYGASCRRRDPRHWRDHTHPPGTQPPTAGNKTQVKRKRQAKKHSESDDDKDDDDDIGDDSPVLNKKRTRKTINIQNDWDDSDSPGEVDPYATDDDDTEWQPSESQ